MASKEIEAVKAAAEHVEHDAHKDAKIASEQEHATTLWQALKTNKKSALWSAAISLTIIMYEAQTVLRAISIIVSSHTILIQAPQTCS